MNESPLVSVVIRNRNEGKNLRRVLQALSLQDLKPTDIVLVDNESEDDSIKIGLEFGAKIISITKSSFTYGRALNLGIKETTGDICVLLSAHCLPLGRNFLNECARPFADERVGAARCLHVGKKMDMERWFNPELIHTAHDVGLVVSKGPLANGCVIRKSVWLEVPFNEEIIAAEDKVWALETLKKGYTIYSPCPALYLYMSSTSPHAAIRKNRRELVTIYQQTGVKLGFASVGAIGAMVDMSRAIFIDAPVAGLRVIARAALLNYSRVFFSSFAKKKAKSGSLY